MRFELDLIRASVPPEPTARTEPTRKHLREATDAVIHDALLVNDLPELVRLSAEAMHSVATALLRYEVDPQVPDFVEAAQALIEDGRAVMDRGLMINNWETVGFGAVMLEIAIRGIFAALNVPYDKVLAEVHRAAQAGDNAAVRAILIEAGLLKGETTDEAEPAT